MYYENVGFSYFYLYDFYLFRFIYLFIFRGGEWVGVFALGTIRRVNVEKKVESLCSILM